MDRDGSTSDGETVELPEKAKEAIYRQLKRLMLSCSDFAQAMSAATFLMQEYDDKAAYGLPAWRKFRCYETTLVVAYARPFSKSEVGVPTFGLKAVNMKLTSDERALHDKIIDFRNKLYGHSDPDAVDMRVLCLHEVFKHNGVEMNLIMPRFDETARLSSHEILALSELSARLHHAAFKKAQELGAQFKDRFRVLEMDISGSTDRPQ